MILEHLRGHVMCENKLHAVWVPDHQTRADRALVRQRLSLAHKITRVKVQIQSWLKCQRLRKPSTLTRNWRGPHRAWLKLVSHESHPGVPLTAQLVLQSLLRQLESLETEAKVLEGQIAALSQQPRYAQPLRVLVSFTGVALLSAMVYLTEMGDMRRFRNRKQIGAYLGLVPSISETGETDDRKGHITRQGPGRVRAILCQAVWSRIRYDEETAAYFADLKRRQPRRKKVMVVAHMRKLAIRMWHKARDAQVRAGSFAAEPDPST